MSMNKVRGQSRFRSCQVLPTPVVPSSKILAPRFSASLSFAPMIESMALLSHLSEQQLCRFTVLIGQRLHAARSESGNSFQQVREPLRRAGVELAKGAAG